MRNESVNMKTKWRIDKPRVRWEVKDCQFTFISDKRWAVNDQMWFEPLTPRLNSPTTAWTLTLVIWETLIFMGWAVINLIQRNENILNRIIWWAIRGEKLCCNFTIINNRQWTVPHPQRNFLQNKIQTLDLDSHCNILSITTLISKKTLLVTRVWKNAILRQCWSH